MLCEYKDIFGKPGQDAHNIRIFDFAVVDVVFTIIGAYVLYKLFGKKYNLSFFMVLLYLFILGIVLHRVFCVRTTIDKILFF